MKESYLKGEQIEFKREAKMPFEEIFSPASRYSRLRIVFTLKYHRLKHRWLVDTPLIQL